MGGCDGGSSGEVGTDLASSRYWSVKSVASFAKFCDVSTVRSSSSAAARNSAMPAAPYPSVDAAVATVV